MAAKAVLLLIRPERQARALAESLALPAGVEVLVSPILRIAAVAHAPVVAKTVILTSANAVPAARDVNAAQVFAVGARTADAAAAAGLVARSADGDAAALVEMVVQARPPEPIVHLRGAHAVGDVAQRLRAAGLRAEDVVVYAQHAQDLTDAARAALRGQAPVIVPLYSPRSARLFLEAAQGAIAPVRIVAISESVAAPVRQTWPHGLVVASHPTGVAMKRAIMRQLVDTSRLEAERSPR